LKIELKMRPEFRFSEELVNQWKKFATICRATGLRSRENQGLYNVQ